ncbi:hypothetical protein [Cohnella sp. REN36]|uniref:hypothetical protein n=1 Tax=Cohnella sp. REN36 TaxID=2887347 RepID=UPI001D15DA2B|nr:hypothetical protein [Cohnella sp. REN36]MCC3373125.1 hypothetical protein [Cohnella sp. REN36]
MQLRILHAEMRRDEEEGYVGRVQFEAEGHRVPYEIVLQSKKGKEWSYSLLFASESGDDDEIEAVDDELDENDALFDQLVQAARAALSL